MKVLAILFALVAFAAADEENKTPQYDIELGETVFRKPINDLIHIENIGISEFQQKILKELATYDLSLLEEGDGIRATLNQYADKIFANLKPLIMRNGLDPLPMEDIETGFNFTLIIRYHGELSLTKGWLQDISSLHRSGDVVVDYNPKTQYLEVTVPIEFDVLQFQYDYSAKLMGLGPTGGIEGKVSDIAIRVKLGFNTTTLNATLDEFYITNSGHISLHFNGHALVDWLLNILSEVATTVLKKAILLVVELVIRGGLTTAVNLINQLIHGILNPPAIFEAAIQAVQTVF